MRQNKHSKPIGLHRARTRCLILKTQSKLIPSDRNSEVWSFGPKVNLWGGKAQRSGYSKKNILKYVSGLAGIFLTCLSTIIIIKIIIYLLTYPIDLLLKIISALEF